MAAIIDVTDVGPISPIGSATVSPRGSGLGSGLFTPRGSLTGSGPTPRRGSIIPLRAPLFKVHRQRVPPVKANRVHAAIDAAVFNKVAKLARAKRCIVSFPGAFMSVFNKLSHCCAQGRLSSGCVFLPENDPLRRYGRHASNPETESQCFCHSLYGETQEWGCAWFDEWRSNVEDAVRLGHTLIVVFLPGQHNLGVLKWEDLTGQGQKQKLWNEVGLGGSQKGEVAWLRRKGYAYLSVDVNQLVNYFALGDETSSNVVSVPSEDHRKKMVDAAAKDSQAAFSVVSTLFDKIRGVHSDPDLIIKLHKDVETATFCFGAAAETLEQGQCKVDKLFSVALKEMVFLLRALTRFAEKTAEVKEMKETLADTVDLLTERTEQLQSTLEQSKTVASRFLNPAQDLRANPKRLKQAALKVQTMLLASPQDRDGKDKLDSIELSSEMDEPNKGTDFEDEELDGPMMDKKRTSICVGQMRSRHSRDPGRRRKVTMEGAALEVAASSRTRTASRFTHKNSERPGSREINHGRSRSTNAYHYMTANNSIGPGGAYLDSDAAKLGRTPRQREGVMTERWLWPVSCMAQDTPAGLSPKPGRPFGGRMDAGPLRRRQPPIQGEIAVHYGPSNTMQRRQSPRVRGTTMEVAELHSMLPWVC